MQDRVIPYLSLDELVDEYMISTLNDQGRLVLNYHVHAKWIWRELMIGSEWAVVSQWVKVQVDEESGQAYIELPKGVERFISLERVDARGRLRPFLADDHISVLAPVASNGVCCPSCGGQDGMGAALKEMTVVTRPVQINGVTYIEKLWKKLEPSGDFLEIRETPALDNSVSPAVVSTTTLVRKVCSFEVMACGCISRSDSNRQLFQLYCGGHTVESRRRALCGRQWAKIRKYGNRVYFSFEGAVPDFVLLTSQTNGEGRSAEIMIPQHMADAMIFGIHWRAGALAPASVVSPTEKRERAIEWEKAKTRLLEYLNPLSPADFLDIQMRLPKWGATMVEEECFEFPLEQKRDAMDKCCLTEARINEIVEARLAAMVPAPTQVLQGPQGEKGDPGPASTQKLSYEHDQTVAAAVWTIDHNLGYLPNVEVVDANGTSLWGWKEEQVSINQLKITHSFPVAGKAYVS
jgi:hypothetical protein